MHRNLLSIKKSTDGAALVEYGVLVGLISVLAIGAVFSLGDRVKTTFGTATETLASNLAENGSTEVAGGATGGAAFDWTVASTYPAAADCVAASVGAGGGGGSPAGPSEVAGETCYDINPAANGQYNFGAATDRHVYKIVGSTGDPYSGSAINPSSGGADTMITLTAPSGVTIEDGPGIDNFNFTNQASSNVTYYADTGSPGGDIYFAAFDDGSQIMFLGGADNIHYAGDGQTHSRAYIAANSTPGFPP